MAPHRPLAWLRSQGIAGVRRRRSVAQTARVCPVRAMLNTVARSNHGDSDAPRALVIRATCAAPDRLDCPCRRAELHDWFWGGSDVGLVGRQLRIELPPLPGGPDATIRPL